MLFLLIFQRFFVTTSLCIHANKAGKLKESIGQAEGKPEQNLPLISGKHHTARCSEKGMVTRMNITRMNKDKEHVVTPLSEYDKKAVGKRIRRIRVQYDLTQAEFAESIDVATNFISELENGRKGMSTETLCNISRRYRLTTDYILFGRQDNAFTFTSLEQALCALPTEDIPPIIQYLQSLYKIRQMDNQSIFKP